MECESSRPPALLFASPHIRLGVSDDPIFGSHYWLYVWVVGSDRWLLYDSLQGQAKASYLVSIRRRLANLVSRISPPIGDAIDIHTAANRFGGGNEISRASSLPKTCEQYHVRSNKTSAAAGSIWSTICIRSRGSLFNRSSAGTSAAGDQIDPCVRYGRKWPA